MNDRPSSLLASTPAGVGAILRELRVARKLTQAQLAERAGVSRAWLIRAEDGAPGIELGRLLQVLRALDVELQAVDRSPEAASADDLLSSILGDDQ